VYCLTRLLNRSGDHDAASPDVGACLMGWQNGPLQWRKVAQLTVGPLQPSGHPSSLQALNQGSALLHG